MKLWITIYQEGKGLVAEPQRVGFNTVRIVNGGIVSVGGPTEPIDFGDRKFEEGMTAAVSRDKREWYSVDFPLQEIFRAKIDVDGLFECLSSPR